MSAVILIWLCIMCALGSAVFLLYSEDIVVTKNYFETSNFKAEFSELLYNVVESNVKLKSEENIKSSGEKEDIIKDKLERLYAIKSSISETVNFVYCIKNPDPSKTITNIAGQDAVALIKRQPTVVHITQVSSDINYFNYLIHGRNRDIHEILSGTTYEVYAAVIEPLKPGDAFYDGFMAYSKIKVFVPYAIAGLIISIILLIITSIYLLYVSGRKEKGGEVVLTYIDRIYTDVHSFLVLIAAGISIAAVREISPSRIEEIVFALIVFSIDIFIGLSYVLSMTRQIKNGQILKNTLIYKIFKGLKAIIKLCFNNKLFKAWTLLLLLGYGAANCILFGIFVLSFRAGFFGFLFSTFLLIAFNVAVVYFVAKSLLSLSQIMGAVKEISVGNIDYTLDSSKISVAFSSFAEDIQSIQGGLKEAVAEAVKGERMKTELITNVSHDLKTPLTSIINYVDLLKKEDLHNQKAKEYVGVLEEKSARLKKLIEDLVEASKASSGNLAVNTEKVDLHELIMQAGGEYDEKIKKAGLDIRINDDEKKTLICADGKYMWRIVENLLSNVVKYSMPNSRVYVNIARNDLNAILTIKNISAFPLDISPEQLTERFVRGDASRTTEGSGLGLSIAQSLANLQGGRFKVEIDGDLFKVTVEIPLWKES